MKKLHSIIAKKAKKGTGCESDVVYLSKDNTSIGSYESIKPYSAQLGMDEGHFSVSFMGDSKTMIIFSTKVTERTEDRRSYEKYKGLIYVFEPMTDQIELEIIAKIFN